MAQDIVCELLPITGRRDGKNKQVVGYAKVDSDLRGILARYSWCLMSKGYPMTKAAVIGDRKGPITLHRYVWYLRHGELPPAGLQIDHEDRDKLNAQSGNLRAVDGSTNLANSGRARNNTSGYRGVCWYKPYGRWMARIKCRGRYLFLGYHDSAEEAAKAVDDAYRLHHPSVKVPNGF